MYLPRQSTHLRRITSKLPDIRPNPLQRRALVPQAEIRRAILRHLLPARETKHAQAIIECDVYEGPVGAGAIEDEVGREVERGRAARVSAAMAAVSVSVL